MNDGPVIAMFRFGAKIDAIQLCRMHLYGVASVHDEYPAVVISNGVCGGC